MQGPVRRIPWLSQPAPSPASLQRSGPLGAWYKSVYRHASHLPDLVTASRYCRYVLEYALWDAQTSFPHLVAQDIFVTLAHTLALRLSMTLPVPGARDHPMLPPSRNQPARCPTSDRAWIFVWSDGDAR